MDDAVLIRRFLAGDESAFRSRLNWKEGRAQFIFRIEPRVLSVAGGSPLRVGDTVISVDREAITTAEGSEAFTYPIRAIHQVEVRRNGTKAVLFREVTTDCSAHVPQATAVGPPQPYTVEIGAGEIDAASMGSRWRAVPRARERKDPMVWTTGSSTPGHPSLPSAQERRRRRPV
jgi:hypothetical protein